MLVSLRDGRPELLYARPHLRRSAGRPRGGELRAGRLSHHMEEPLRRWRVTLEGRSAVDLVFEALTPAVQYPGGALPEGVGDAHLEQTGRVTGWIRAGGRTEAISGLGQRDRSWGDRDWGRIAGWDWIYVHAGADLGLSLWHGPGAASAAGYVHHQGDVHAIESVELSHRGGRPHLPEAIDIGVIDGSGAEHRLEAVPTGRLPLWRGGLWIEELPARFTWKRSGHPARVGVGLVEHAWHAGVVATLRGARALIGTAVAALRP